MNKRNLVRFASALSPFDCVLTGGSREQPSGQLKPMGNSQEPLLNEQMRSRPVCIGVITTDCVLTGGSRDQPSGQLKPMGNSREPPVRTFSFPERAIANAQGHVCAHQSGSPPGPLVGSTDALLSAICYLVSVVPDAPSEYDSAGLSTSPRCCSHRAV